MSAEHCCFFQKLITTFDGDDRVDSTVFFVVTPDAWRFLDETFVGLRVRHDTSYASKLLLIYFATRLYGVAAVVPMLLAQRLERKAINMMH